MKFSAQWLAECLRLPETLSIEALAETLTQAGLEVDERLADELDSSDTLFTLKTPANRGDCLSLLGIARDAAAVLGVETTKPWGSLSLGEARSEALGLDIELEKPSACPRYCLARVQGISAQTETPAWIQARLRKSGLKTRFPVVDILNYVMLELGQPMHAFDADKIQGKLQVRLARRGESITLLDGAQVDLSPDTLVIADAQGPQAIAGVMGAQASAVSERTKAVFLESAYFDPILIRQAARTYRRRTDSAIRFERGTDPEAVPLGLARAIALLENEMGAKCQAWAGVEDLNSLPKPRAIAFTPRRVSRILGYELPPTDMQAAFKCLGLDCQVIAEDTWSVIVPSYRPDLQLEVDLIEELARLQGLDRILAVTPSLPLLAPKVDPLFARSRQLKQMLQGRGFQEVITYSFLDPSWFRLCHETEPKIRLLNPISQEMAVMRLRLLPGLLTCLSHHQRHYAESAAFFEWGCCFLGTGPSKNEQPTHLAAVLEGQAWQATWGLSAQATVRDFYSVKQDLEVLLAAILEEPLNLDYRSCGDPQYHPSQSAELYWKNQWIGTLGAVHPRLIKQLELSGQVFAFELNMDALPAKKTVTFQAFSRFPGMSRDLALLVTESVKAADLQATVQAQVLDPDWRLTQTVFDVYHGKGIPAGQKSLGLTLSVRHQERTLREEEMEAFMTRVLSALGQTHGAILRQ